MCKKRPPTKFQNYEYVESRGQKALAGFDTRGEEDALELRFTGSQKQTVIQNEPTKNRLGVVTGPQQRWTDTSKYTSECENHHLRRRGGN